ncbi:MAG: lysine--tRNA ligase [Phycisphaerales bacterium]|nr:lysine--tRNA ligase [Phycisphaerales bacterium]
MPDTSTPTQSPDQSPAEDLHKLELQRRENRDAVAKLGALPYGRRVDGIMPLADAIGRFDEHADEHHKAHAKDEDFVDQRPVVRVAGRIVLHRDNGKLIWLNLRDDTGDLQVAVSQRDCILEGPVGVGGFDAAKQMDLGDVVVCEGPLVRTRTGEITVWASTLAPASKCLVPPPEKHAGLQDMDTRYRQRYLDMWATPETMRVFRMRSKIVSAVRSFMDSREYAEVETPMLQAMAGGAAARPFTTHINALDMPLYMRIAPELYLKRLLVGGMKRVYEINRNFRNEGVDKQHNPEFTMMECYEAFGDYTTMMDLSESLMRELARMILGAGADETDLKLPFGDHEVDYGSPFDRVTYAELFERALGFSMNDEAKVRAEATKRNIAQKNEKGEPIDIVLIINELFEDVAEPTLNPAKPTFITEYPAAISPLTRPNPDRPDVADRADLFIGHMEIGPMYTELNDPDVQAEKFRAQLSGIDDEEQTFRNFDHDFIRALKIGMPPAGGLGLGIDRIAMLLTNQRSIRDVILFPLLRPE